METIISPSPIKVINPRLSKKLNLPDRIADRKDGDCSKEAAAHYSQSNLLLFFYSKGKEKIQARSSKYRDSVRSATFNNFQPL